MEVDEMLNKFFNIFEDSDRLVSNPENRKKIKEAMNAEMEKYFQ